MGSPRQDQRAQQSKKSSIRVFISHAHKDKRLADEVVALLDAALPLPRSAIRHTSGAGTRLPGGVWVDDQLRRDVRDAVVFIAIVSARSVMSEYVLFEMGARWGPGKHVMPLLAPRAPESILPGPFRGLNALRLDSSDQIDQFVGEVAQRLVVSASTSGRKYRRHRRQIARIRISHPGDAARKNAELVERLGAENAALLDQVGELARASWHARPTLDRLTVKSQFDDTGSGEEIRQWFGLRTAEKFTNLPIDYAFGISNSQGRAPNPRIVELQDPKSELAVQFTPTPLKKGQRRDPRRAGGTIEVVGALTETTPFVGFEIRQPFQNAFYMRRAEVAVAYAHDRWKQEYVSAHIMARTELLEISVTFPPTFAGVSATAVVFSSADETREDRETERIQTMFTFESQTASIRVSRPVQGFHYAITWMPPR